MFDLAANEHEEVHYFYDQKTGLRAIIAIHSTILGPAIGGCRLLPYAHADDALLDVLRLSKGMTHKCAIGEIPFGGGKAVIIADPTQKSKQLLTAYAQSVSALKGRYITSFDSGTTLNDVKFMGTVTPYVGGIQPKAGNASESTADMVFACLLRALEMETGSRTVDGRHVTIQGLGNVGIRLARRVLQSGGRVTACDVNETSKAVGKSLGCELVEPADIFAIPADAFAPCALGGVLNNQTIHKLQVPIVCGGANNQLAGETAAQQIARKGILFCPDFLANSGGIIDLHYQLNNVDRAALPAHLHRIADKLYQIAKTAKQRSTSTQTIAKDLAEAHINGAQTDHIFA